MYADVFVFYIINYMKRVYKYFLNNVFILKNLEISLTNIRGGLE